MASDPLASLGRAALTALVLACGAADDEVNAVADRLAWNEVPEDREVMIAQVREAIYAVREFRAELDG